MTLPRFLTALLPLVAAACLSGTDPISVTPATVEETTFATALGVDVAASTGTQSGLYYRDLTVGTGQTISAGDSTEVYYSAYLSTGVEFDSLKTPAVPLKFQVGSLDIIPGFSEGVIGMKVGGTRQLLIPPAIAFGFSDYQGIPGNSVVVFNVEAVSTKSNTP